MSEIDDTLREELSALLDDALPAERAAELRRRLESDAALRKEFDELRRTVEAVRKLPRPPAPPELRERLERRLSAPPASRIRRIRFRLAVAAVVTVAVGAGVLALRPSGPVEPVHQQAQQPPAPRAGAKEEAGVAAAEPAADEALRRETVPPKAPRRETVPPEAPAERRDAVLEEAETTGRKALGAAKQAGRGAPAREPVEGDVDRPMLSLTKEKGETKDKDKEAGTLLTLATLARAAPENRRPYLAQLNQLNAKTVEAHLQQLTTTLGASYALSTPLPRSASLTVTDLDEARQIYTVLDKYPGTAGRGSSATLVPAGNAGRTSQLTAEVEVTPQQWRSVGSWLHLMDVAAERERPTVRTEESHARDRSKMKSRATAAGAEAPRAPAPVDENAKRKVRIFIRYPRPARAAREK